MRIPDIVAHRGYTLRCPENTLVAVHSAIDAGARHVEIDVQMSADGVPVLFHDRSLQRLCGVDGAIHEKTLEELCVLRAADSNRFGERHSDERIATLKALGELIACHPQVQVFVEIKRIAIERFGPEEVFSAVMRDIEPIAARCVLISFSTGFLRVARERLPHQRIAVVADRWEHLAEPDVRTLQPEYVFCDLDGLPEAGMLRPPGDARLAIYEVADGPLALRLAARGVDMIETFACAEMLQFLVAAPTSI